MGEVKHTPLGALELVCGDIFARWDADMRAGKLLTALSGLMAPGHDPRVDQVRAALSSHADLLEALNNIFALGSDGEHSGDRHARCRDIARAAIAKATGSDQ